MDNCNDTPAEVCIISSAEKIDLNRHGVIEAHAGTGKTYTIVKLMLRMLEQPRHDGFVHLRDILLMTYTEKAAGELQKRVLEEITGRINELRGETGEQSERLITHLEDCLNKMHEALIGTIHSVCLRLLQTWPFETGVHFDTQITNDYDTAQAVLRESMRTDWQDKATGLPSALSAMERFDMKIERKHLKLIRDTAVKFSDGGRKIYLGGILETPGMSESAEAFKDNANAIEKRLTRLKGDIEHCLTTLKPLVENYMELLSALHAAGVLETKRQDVIVKLISEFDDMIKTGVYDIKRLANPNKAGIAVYTAKERGGIPNASAIDAAIEEIKTHPYIDAVKESAALRDRLFLITICHAAKILSVRYNAHKRINGLISYDDMLQLTDKAVKGENSAMLETLRRRLRYGIIDEFQDTSVIQWSIFKKIFLDGAEADDSAAKMYVVGDPKQSIYSFQNADINCYITAKRTITNLRGTVYCLVDNYRSLPEMICGYNAILSRKAVNERGENADWFLYGSGGDISYPSSGKGGKCAKPPARNTPKYPLPADLRPIQVIKTDGATAQSRRKIAARAARIVIEKLRGRAVSIPDGSGWKDLTLDYKDFAVIVEKHVIAEPFIEEFWSHGIPCVKYKLKGVFNSPMARDLIAVLTAVQKRGDPHRRAAALLTHFFNRPPNAIDPVRDTIPCDDPYCQGAKLCAAHALEYWGFLADRQLWAQLFKSIAEEKTRVRQRLVRLVNGERHLADLRQISDYCVSYLYLQNSNLKQLTEHLERLYDNEESAEQDKNIHVLSTERSSVKILTMHASKGLEFPVVFAMNDDTENLQPSPNIMTWTDEDQSRRFIPYLQNPKNDPGLEEQVRRCALEMRRERRRLFYVAVTRPQAMLFLPMRKEDKELAPRLSELLSEEAPEIEFFREDFFGDGGNACERTSRVRNAPPQTAELEDIPKLSLRKFIIRETSYSQLSKIAGDRRNNPGYDEEQTADHDGEARDDEHHAEDLPHTSPLKRGRRTGDALHRAIEEILNTDDVNAVISDAAKLNSVVVNYLKSGGILDGLSEDGQRAAAEQAVSHIRAALTAPYHIAGRAAPVIIADLKKRDRVPEMEFLLSVKPHRIRGFIDLVFRLRNNDCPEHPYIYYAADWKSDTLDDYGGGSIEKYCREKKYLLQAQIYTLALDKYLRGILGARYDREKNLGGALYVFLRGFESCQDGMISPSGEIYPTKNIWYYPACPQKDEGTVRGRVLNFF